MDWRWQLANLIRTPDDLGTYIGKPVSAAGWDESSTKMWITPYFAGLIDPDDPDDPILRQVLPGPEEMLLPAGTSMDPLKEEAHSPVRGLIHRYPDRVLLTTTGFCPSLCRFCMRRRCWSSNPEETRFDLEPVLTYIGSRKEVKDVIVSGGDPLFLPNSTLGALLRGVKAISHVEIIRIGSRTPATLPMRIDRDLVEFLREFKPLWFLSHFNHPREITPEAEEALGRLVSAGAVLNNQTVLLRGVNDSTSTLEELSRRLLRIGVRPYYLHQVDFIGPADHYRVPVEDGVSIVKTLFGRISGLGIPRYVLDLPGGGGKVPLTPDFRRSDEGRPLIFEAPLGGHVEIQKERRSSGKKG